MSCMRTRPGCRRLARLSTNAGCPGRSGSSTPGRLTSQRHRHRALFYNRMSASSHTRNHPLLCGTDRRGACLAHPLGQARGERTRCVGPRDQQGTAVRRTGTPRHCRIAHGAGRRPRTRLRRRIAALRGSAYRARPRSWRQGLGVQLFQSSDSLAAYLASEAYGAPVDGLHLLQEYVRAPGRS